jgi:hypothetical protein
MTDHPTETVEQLADALAWEVRYSRASKEQLRDLARKVAEHTKKQIAKRLLPMVWEEEAGPTISWMAVLEALSFDTPESRVKFTYGMGTEDNE